METIASGLKIEYKVKTTVEFDYRDYHIKVIYTPESDNVRLYVNGLRIKLPYYKKFETNTDEALVYMLVGDNEAVGQLDYLYKKAVEKAAARRNKKEA